MMEAYGELMRSAVTDTHFSPIEENIGYFQIDAVSGELRATRPLSYAERSSYRMMVTARDQGMPPLQGQAVVDIQVFLGIVQIGKIMLRTYFLYKNKN